MDWLEENGGTIVVVGAIIFFGWLFLSSSANNSSTSQSGDTYESSVDDGYYYDDEETVEPEEFYGYECSDDCSGHEAGYDWADENGLCYEYSSGDEYWDSYSDSFNEGATAYIEENC